MEDVFIGVVVQKHIRTACIHAVPNVINLILKKISDEDIKKVEKNLK